MSVGGRALSDVRVLDLTQALAGPFCTQLLADQGAEVIKVEPPRGDMLRGTGPFPAEDRRRTTGGVFQNANRNKRSIVLDLKHPDAREIVLDLAATADVLVENFSQGVMTRLGLDYETLAARNPRLVYTSIRGFGDERGGASPYAAWPAFDIVAQAMGGLMSITGPDPRTPTRVGSGIGDTVSALFAAVGTLTALHEARRSGRGQYVDIAMVDAVLAVSEVVVNQYAATGESPRPGGNRLNGFAPFDTFPAADGTVALGAPHQPQWAKLCAVMDRPELADDPRFRGDEARWSNREEVGRIVGEWTRRRTVRELIDQLGGVVPLGPIFDAEDIFHDPHFAARQMLPEVPHPATGGTIAITGVVPKLSRTPGGIARRAPLLGEHSAEILREFGYSEDRITELSQHRVIADARTEGTQS